MPDLTSAPHSAVTRGPSPYRSTPSVEALVREAHALFTSNAVRVSPSKVIRACREYVNIVSAHGIPFGDYLETVAALDGQQRRAFDDIYNRLSYVDTTGETAVHNVLAGGGAA